MRDRLLPPPAGAAPAARLHLVPGGEYALPRTMHLPTRPPRPQASQPLRFLVSATRADGHTEHWSATGGCSMDHIQHAMDHAGLGGVVRVQPLRDLLETA